MLKDQQCIIDKVSGGFRTNKLEAKKLSVSSARKCKDCYRHIREFIDENLTLLKEVEKFKNLNDTINRACNKEMTHDNFYDDYNELNDTSSESNTMSEENEDHVKFLSNMKKGFLHKNAQEDSRKKLHEEIDEQWNE